MTHFKNLTFSLLSLCTLNANALTVSGKMYVGPVYYIKNPSNTPSLEDKVVIETAASKLYFKQNFYDDSNNGPYFLYEGDINNNLTIKHAYLGYQLNNIDARMGTLDSLVYTWVGSYSDPWNYGSNIAIVPQYNRYLSNSAKMVGTLGGQFQLGIDAGLSDNSRDYNYYDIGGKWTNQILTISTVYQDNNKDSATNFENRNTWASAIAYDVSKRLTLSANYAHYSKTRASNSHDDAFSIGGHNQDTFLSYQTSQNKDQARINLMHLISIAKSTSIGVELQIPVNSKYYKDGATTKSDDTSFTTIYLGYKF